MKPTKSQRDFASKSTEISTEGHSVGRKSVSVTVSSLLIFCARSFTRASLIGGFFSALFVFVVLSSASVGYAQTIVYWDTNGATTGTNATGSGTWVGTGGSSLWTTNATGNVAASTWAALATTANTIANFSTGTSGTGTQTVFTSGTISNVGGITFDEGTVTIAAGGTLSLSQNASFTANSAGTSTVAATIAESGGARVLTKAGTGTLLLSGANSYTGNTTITTGLLSIASATALGTTASGTTVSSGASLELQGGITVGAEALSINGVGSASSGALRNLNGTNTYGGLITLAGPSTIQSDAGSLALTNTGTITGATFGLTLTGAQNGSIASIIGTTSGTLTKAGNGTWTLSGNNTYTGLTTISAGTLKLGASGDATNTPLGTTTNGTTVSAGGALDLNGFTLGAAEGLTLNGTGVRSSGALTNSGAAATWSGTVALGSATTIGGTGNILITGTTSGNFVLTKEGSNNLTFTKANSTTSTVFINHGTLTLGGSAGTMTAATGYTLNPGAALTLDNSSAYISRLRAATAITANGGVFTYTPVATSSNAQSAGAFALKGGVTMNTTGTGVGFTSTLAFAAFSRTVGGTMTFSGDSLLGSDTRNYITFSSGATSVAGVLPWAVITKDGGTTYNFADYAAGRVQAQTTYTTTAETNWSANTIEARPAADATLSGLRILNVLALDSGIDVALAGNSLTLGNGANPGAILKTGATVSTITGTGSVAFAAREAIFHIFDAGGLSISSLMTGTGGITKSGTGTLTLSGASVALSGTITLNDGTLRAENISALGNATIGAPLVINGGTLELANNSATAFSYNTTVKGDATIKSDIVSGTTGVTHTLGTLTMGTATNPVNNLTIDRGSLASGGAPAITFGATTLAGTGSTFTVNTGATLNLGAISGTGFGFTVGGAGNTNITGAISTGTGGTLDKNGTGTLSLSGANNHTGATTINAGLVSISNATALGTTATGTTVANGASLELQGGIIVGAEALTLEGTGSSSNGALRNLIGSNTYGGLLTLTGNTSIQSDAGTLALTNTGTLTGSGFGLTLTGAGNGTLASIVGTGSGTLNKSGNGTWTLTGANTFTGDTTIGAGSLVVQNSGALSSTGNISITSGGQLSLNAAGTETAPTYVVGNPTAISTFAVGRGPDTVTVAGAGPGGSSAAIINSYSTAGGSFVQVNDNVVLNGSATFSSGSTSGNTLAIGRRGNYNAPAGTTVDTNSTVNVNGNTLTLIGSAGTTVRIEGGLTGTGNLTINTSGSVLYYGPENTFSGTTTVANGTLKIDTSPNNAAPNDTGYNKFYGVSGPLVIGDGNGANNSAIVYLGDGTVLGGTPEAIKPTSSVTIYQDGLLSLKNNGQTIGQLTMTGGKIDSGSGGILYLDIPNTAVTITPTATSGPSTIDGNLYLTYHLWAPSESAIRQNRTFDVGYDASNVGTGDLVVNANINVGSLTKIGAGTMTLQTSNNDYDGTTTITNGILNVRVATNVSDKSSLGLSGGANMGTSVSGTGTLQMQGGIAITKEELSLSGNGYNGTQGALENLSGNNTWGTALTGQITLTGNATIGSTTGLLTIPTTFSSTGGPFGLTVRGAGDTTITGAINTGTTSAATLTKMDAGTLTLSGTSNFYGLTDIQGGIVVVTSSDALGNTAGGTSVSTGAELRLTNNIAIGSEALTLNGTGNGVNTGALRNFSGSNTYGGAITIGATGTRINSDTGLLTLTGGISTSGKAFVVGGVGNTTETGAVGGSGALTKDGTGTATFSNITGVGNVTMNKGTLTFSGSSTTGSTVNMNEGTLNFNGATATVGQVHLLGGALSTISVGASSTLTTNEFDSSVSSTLAIASGGSVVANYNTGNTLFSGQITGSGGTFKALGTGQVTFDHTIINTGLTVFIGGTSIGTNFTPITFTITGATTLQFGTIHITGDTILDFGNSSASVLNSANLIIDVGVKITVNNWISLTDAWYATSTFTGSVLDRTAGTPENQITFNGFSNNSTTWATIATYGYFEHEIRPVPEPSTYGAIFISGCLGVIGLRRYRRHLVAKTK